MAISVVGSPKNRKAYRFLKAIRIDKQSFNLGELLSATGWRKETATQYLSTRLKPFVCRSDKGYKVLDTLPMSEDEFCCLVSQSVSLSRNPLRPQISIECEHRVVKAREAALAAIQNYNNPTATFRTGTYLILMIVAYTSLFHAIFERQGVSYVRRNERRESQKIAGGDILWDALESAQYYAANYASYYLDDQNPKFLSCMIENIRLLLPIRHVFEHRDMPPLDATLAAHCQSMLFNFETILHKEFTSYYSINSSLAVTLQFSTVRNDAAIATARRFHSQEYTELKQYINNFHAGLTDDIIENPAFAFRVWLIPKPAKDARKSDISIEYVHLDTSDPDQMAALQQSIVAIKQSIKFVSNTGYLKPGEVSDKVAEAIGRVFTCSTHHARAWRHFSVRPEKGAAEPHKTNGDFCVYDEPHKDYVYTSAWVGFLIKQMQRDDVCEIIYGKSSKYK